MGQCSWIFIFRRFMSTAFFWISSWQLHPPCRLSAEQACPSFLTTQETPPAGRCAQTVPYNQTDCFGYKGFPWGKAFGAVGLALTPKIKIVGADALIGPGADGMDASVFSSRSGDAPRGAMWASLPTETRKPSLGQVTVSQLLKNSAQTARAAFFYCWSTSNLYPTPQTVFRFH